MVFQVNYFSPYCGWWRMGISKYAVHHGIAGQGVIRISYSMSFDVVGKTLASVQPNFQGSLSLPPSKEERTLGTTLGSV